MGLDIDQQIQVELLEQEKLRTAMVRLERDEKAKNGQLSRQNRHEWGKWLRKALTVLGVLGALVGIGSGISYLTTGPPPPPPSCVESHTEFQIPLAEERRRGLVCNHPDHKVEVEEKEYKECGFRRVKITCLCPADSGLAPAPVE